MNALHEARTAAGLTAYQLAQAAGSREPRIFAFERERYRPRTDEAQRIAVALGREVEDLFPDGMQRGGQW